MVAPSHPSPKPSLLLTTIQAQTAFELDQLLKYVPNQHRGVCFEKIWNSFASTNENILQLVIAEIWGRLNNPEQNAPILPRLLGATETEARQKFTPQNEREWEVANCAAATVMQFMGTKEGLDFLEKAFERAGGSIQYKTPIKDY